MIIIDANVLLHAYNADAPQQQASARWSAGVVDSREPVGLPWNHHLGFPADRYKLKNLDNPLSPEQAFGIVAEWLKQPGIVLLLPGPRHLDLLRQLVTQYDATGSLVTDAVLAAIALENGATIASTDQDVRRFPSVRWVNPVKPQ